MNNNIHNKADLRTRAKDIRKNLDMNAISIKLINKMRQKAFYINAENILLFHPMENEINLLDLLNDNKNFYLPKVNGKNLLICPYCCGDTLKLSPLNIKEPCSNPINPQILDIIIVPALMIDKNNNRLGYGGGFYDRFIAQNPDIKSVVLIPKELTVNTLPAEIHDQKINYVIT